MAKRIPTPRFDRSKNAYYCRIRGRKYYLSRDPSKALIRFHQLCGERNIMLAPDGAPRSVAGACDAYVAVHGQTQFHKYLIRHWVEFQGCEAIADIDEDALKRYSTEILATQAPKTAREKINLAHKILRWCHQKGWLRRVPDKPKLPKAAVRMRATPVPKLAAAIATLPEPARRLATFILETGCRPSEACSLKWSEVELDQSVCILETHKTAKKTGRSRAIRLTSAAKAVLAELPCCDGFVFLNSANNPYDYNQLGRLLRARGIRGTYTLRHSFAQTRLEAGMSLQEIGKLLGHTNINTTQRYAHVTDLRIRELAASLDAILPLGPRAEDPRPHPSQA